MAVREVPVVGAFPSEEGAFYLFDFQYFAEVIGGQTLSSPTVPAVSGLTIGSPSVTATAVDGCPAGKGVLVAIHGSAVGEYTVECTVTLSGGGKRTIRGTFTIE